MSADGSTHTLLEHTADMGLEALAPSREALFVALAEGLADMIFDRRAAREGRSLVVRVDAGDAEELLVAWLNEIVYRIETGDLVPSGFTVRTLTDTSLEAELRGEPFDPRRHAVLRQVKAVTHHHVRLAKTSGGWTGRVYVDL